MEILRQYRRKTKNVVVPDPLSLSPFAIWSTLSAPICILSEPGPGKERDGFLQSKKAMQPSRRIAFRSPPGSGGSPGRAAYSPLSAAVKRFCFRQRPLQYQMKPQMGVVKPATAMPSQ